MKNPDVALLEELARQLPECDRAAKLRALLARVTDFDGRDDTPALTAAAEALAASAEDALADDPWSAFEAAARRLRSRMLTPSAPLSVSDGAAVTVRHKR